MFGLGMPELVIILVITMVIFGPGKLPQIGAAVGGALKNFKKGAEDAQNSLIAKEEEKPVVKEVNEANRVKAHPEVNIGEK